jgi:hypothetical protein
MNPDEQLDRLFASARDHSRDTSRAEFGFETRVLARLREERKGSWLSWAWRLCPYAAAMALAAGAWGYWQNTATPDGSSLYAAVKLAGMPVLDYYLGDE